MRAPEPVSEVGDAGLHPESKRAATKAEHATKTALRKRKMLKAKGSYLCLPAHDPKTAASITPCFVGLSVFRSFGPSAKCGSQP